MNVEVQRVPDSGSLNRCGGDLCADVWWRALFAQVRGVFASDSGTLRFALVSYRFVAIACELTDVSRVRSWVQYDLDRKVRFLLAGLMVACMPTILLRSLACSRRSVVSGLGGVGRSALAMAMGPRIGAVAVSAAPVMVAGSGNNDNSSVVVVSRASASAKPRFVFE